MPTISQSIVIRATPECVFSVITDFANYPKFLSWTEKARVLKSSKRKVVVAFTANIIKRVNYTLSFLLKPPNDVSWALVEADPIMRSNNGSWRLEELEPGLTDATFSTDIEFSIWMPKPIIASLIGSNLPATLKSFKEQAEATWVFRDIHH